MIAIPDFSSGAMENWGLITYRETALLFNEGVSSESNKKRVATVVSHELAHQVWNKNTLYSKKLSDLIIFQSKQKLTSLESFLLLNTRKKEHIQEQLSHPFYLGVTSCWRSLPKSGCQ